MKFQSSVGDERPAEAGRPKKKAAEATRFSYTLIAVGP
jgi:hypothetical protein